jgi:hypothetical protein
MQVYIVVAYAYGGNLSTQASVLALGGAPRQPMRGGRLSAYTIPAHAPPYHLRGFNNLDGRLSPQPQLRQADVQDFGLVNAVQLELLLQPYQTFHHLAKVLQHWVG